ncbi:Uncharacterised protein [Brevundimonas diminuta]|uniref:Uncharacterized protein n=1 Tax=Brevundimonas diminuta TaxID=293 RepID=A0A2X1AJ51_BREDI|nr:Uncharacterised protein [Brevundimonas diminuta]
MASAVKRLRLSDVSPREEHAMVQAIYRGVNKTRIWEALSARSEGRLIAEPARLPTSLMRGDDELAIEDILIDHAPEDDAIFITYAYFRLLGRDPELRERLTLQEALTKGDLDRRGAVAAVVAASRAEGRSPYVASSAGGEDLAIVSGERSERLLLFKRLSPKDCLVADGALRDASLVDGGLKLHGGLALAGPKRSLKAGLWRLLVDWSQEDDAAIAVEVTSNGGAERLLGLTISGSAVFNAEFRVMPEHLISEVLVYAVRKGAGDWIVRPREVSLQWVSE